MQDAWFERIGATDLQQLVTDVGPVPANVGAVLVLDAGTSPDLVVHLLRSRASAIPRLRQRLMDPPWGGGRPVWVDDPDFDPELLVTAVACPAPADSAALLDLATAIVTQPLDRAGPLWRARVVTGLSDGRAAVVLVLHHVLADGLGGLAVLADLMDSGEAATAAPPPPARPTPSAAMLRRDAWGARARALHRFPQSVRSLRPALAEIRRGRPERAPRTSLNVPSGPRRRVAAIDVPLDAVRRQARASGGTVNDVLLASVAGALGGLLRERGEPVPRLVVSVPVSARPSATTGELGNQVGVMAVPVPTTGSMAARTSMIAATTRAQKDSTRGASAALVAPAFRLLAALGLFRRMIDHQRLVNAFLTSMRGPDEVLALGGAPIRRIVPITQATGNVPVAFAALTYAGTITVAVIGDPDLVPEIDALASTLARELGDDS